MNSLRAINGLMALIASGAMAADLIVPTDFATIQLAIDAAAAGDTVIVEPGTYQESISLRTDIDVRGREAARTFIEAPNANSVVIINNVDDLLFANFTIVDVVVGATVAIDIANSTNVQIANNVLDGEGVIGTGVRIDPTSSVEVLNNVFCGQHQRVNQPERQCKDYEQCVCRQHVHDCRRTDTRYQCRFQLLFRE